LLPEATIGSTPARRDSPQGGNKQWHAESVHKKISEPQAAGQFILPISIPPVLTGGWK